MKIAIDAQQAATENRKTGLGVYVDALLREYSRSAPGDFEFYLMHTLPEWEGEDYGPQFHPVSYRFGRLHSAAILFRLNRVLKEIQADVFHAACTNGIPPNCCCPSIVTVHDLFPLTVPGTPLIQKMFFRFLFAITRRNADMFICNSKYTQDELLKFHVPEEKTKVSYLAPQTSYTPAMRILSKTPFFFCVGALEHRKGQLMLAEAYRNALKTMPDLPDLYFAGPDRGDGIRLKRVIQDCHKIHWLDFIPQDDLRKMYLSASCFLFPSLQEGFGLPLLEAMQAGIPVICSDIPVFHEVGGPCVHYAAPDVQSFTQALLHYRRIISACDPEKSYERSRTFSWANHARQTIDCCRLDCVRRAMKK